MSTREDRTAPIADALTEPYWRGLREERLLLQRNPATGAYQHYPRPFCLDDARRSPEWSDASGHGTIYSQTVVHRGSPLPGPRVIALVDLDEGPRVLAEIVDTPPEGVAIGQRVRAVFKDHGEVRLLDFTPED